jgi:hypothetical protein
MTTRIHRLGHDAGTDAGFGNGTTSGELVSIRCVENRKSARECLGSYLEQAAEMGVLVTSAYRRLRMASRFSWLAANTLRPMRRMISETVRLRSSA